MRGRLSSPVPVVLLLGYVAGCAAKEGPRPAVVTMPPTPTTTAAPHEPPAPVCGSTLVVCNEQHCMYVDAARGRNPEGAQGCVVLGVMYRDGRGVDVDDRKALRLFDQACRSQVSTGCGDLGRLYRDGRAVGRDVAHARKLLEYACKHGDSSGCRDASALNPSSSP